MTLAALLVVTAAAAIRSTWSPCGLSMLSTLTPLSERSRGHRYSLTAGWFVAGALVGGCCLGGLMAGLAAVVGSIGPSAGSVWLALAGAAMVAICADLRLAGFGLPRLRRQVDEQWIGRFRRWVYAGGFGWQIGMGLSTYVMTAGVWLMAALAALSGRPPVALLVGIGFGGVRGLALLLGARASSPSRLHALHRRLTVLEPASLRLAVAAEIGALVIGCVMSGQPAPAVAVVAGTVAACLAVGRFRSVSSRRVLRQAVVGG